MWSDTSTVRIQVTACTVVTERHGAGLYTCGDQWNPLSGSHTWPTGERGQNQASFIPPSQLLFTSLRWRWATLSCLPILHRLLLLSFLPPRIRICLSPDCNPPSSGQEFGATGSLLSYARLSETGQKCSRFAAEPIMVLDASKDIVGAGDPSDDGTCLSTYHPLRYH